MVKHSYFIILILLLVSDYTNAQSDTVNLIVYTYFVNPQATYDSICKDFTQSGLVDSLKIIGRPILVPAIVFKIDTLRVKMCGISMAELQGKIKRIDKLKPLKELEKQLVIADASGRQIRFETFTSICFQAEYYRPEIYLPKPESFKYHGIIAVKIEFYCKNANKKKLVELIKSNIHRYSDFEIVKFEIIQTLL
jgi:hypothetical protein